MNRTRLKFPLWVVIAAGLFARCAYGQEQDAQRVLVLMDYHLPVQSLKDWDDTVAIIDRLAANVHDTSLQGTRNVAGHPIGYYWDQYLTPPEKNAPLEALHRKAEQQSASGDEKGLKATLTAASPLLNVQKFRASMLMTFSRTTGIIGHHLELLQPWLERSTEAELAAASAQATAGDDAAVKGLAAVMASNKLEPPADPALTQAIDASYKALNAQRRRLVAEQKTQPNPFPVPPVHRRSDCPPPTAPVPNRDKPGLAPDFPSSEDFYPAFAKRAQLEGDVVVRVSVSDTGCALRAEVAGTSGSPALDQAALDLAMAGKYIPGTKDGRAALADVAFRVKFEMND